jgi:hypothetical protein
MTGDGACSFEACLPNRTFPEMPEFLCIVNMAVSREREREKNRRNGWNRMLGTASSAVGHDLAKKCIRCPRTTVNLFACLCLSVFNPCLRNWQDSLESTEILFVDHIALHRFYILWLSNIYRVRKECLRVHECGSDAGFSKTLVLRRKIPVRWFSPSVWLGM